MTTYTLTPNRLDDPKLLQCLYCLQQQDTDQVKRRFNKKRRNANKLAANSRKRNRR